MLVKGRCGSASEEARMRGALYRRGRKKNSAQALGWRVKEGGWGGIPPGLRPLREGVWDEGSMRERIKGAVNKPHAMYVNDGYGGQGKCATR